MLKQRLQILVEPTQRRRLEAEAKRRQTSVGSIVREAIDAHLGTVGPEERLRAVEAIRAATTGRFLSPEQLDTLVEDERRREVARIASRTRR
jgi:hypothetical protein